MALRNGHGSGRGVPRIEVLPANELPGGVAASGRRPVLRDESGKFLPGEGQIDLGRAGGIAKREALQLGRLLGLWQPDESHAYYQYWRLACEWRDAHMTQLAATVGGGRVGPGPASIVASAAMQLGASRYLADLGAQTGAPKLLSEATKLADSSRQNLLAAHELAARETKARPPDPANDWVTRMCPPRQERT